MRNKDFVNISSFHEDCKFVKTLRQIVKIIYDIKYGYFIVHNNMDSALKIMITV